MDQVDEFAYTQPLDEEKTVHCTGQFMSQIRHFIRGMMRLLILINLPCGVCGVLVAKDREPAKQTASASESIPTKNPRLAQRDKLWLAATDAARKLDWKSATRFGAAALQYHERHVEDQPYDATRMLESLSFWYVKQRQYSTALIAAKRVLARRRELLGDKHWRTVDARWDILLVERLAELNEDELRQFDGADRLHSDAIDLAAERNFGGALEKAEATRPVYAKFFGDSNPLTLSCLMTIVTCQLELGRYIPAHAHAKVLSERQAEVYGLLHPQTIRTLTLLGRFNESFAAWPNAEDSYRTLSDVLKVMSGDTHRDTIAARVELAKMLVEQEKFAEAEPILITALKQQRAQLGEEHVATAHTSKVLGGLYCRNQRFAEAEPLLDKSVAICRKLAEKDTPATAGALNARGRLRLEKRQFQSALNDFNESLSICNKTLGENHPLTVKVLDNQARLYEATANTGLARMLRLRCLHICEQAFGETNLQTAAALENLARTLIGVHDFGLAEAYLLRARETRRKLLGDAHPQTAITVGQLGLVYLGVGDPDRARPLIEDALRVLDKTAGENEIDAARVRLCLAQILQQEEQYAAAETEYRRALRTFEAPKSKEYFLIAAAKLGLAATLLSRGQLIESRDHLVDVSDIYGGLLKPDDPRWIDALLASGTVSLLMGNVQNAERLLRRSLEIAQTRMQTAGAFESERQRITQFLALRKLLDLYLSLPADSATAGSANVDVVYPHVLAWKGGVATREWRDRQFATAETLPLTAELQQISRWLSLLTLRVPQASEHDNWMGRMFALNLRKEELEQLRAAANRLRSGPPNEVVTPAQLRQVLPAGVVLIDLLQYSQASFEQQAGATRLVAQQRYAAFIVRRDRPVRRVDLGEVTPIAEAITKWRKTRGFRPNPGKTDWAVTVGNLVWPHLKPHVEGCTTVLISPDGHLSQLAWNVLPGERPNSYLIEDFAIATIPVPQLLPAILAETPLSPGSRARSGNSMLLIGDVDYDAAPAAKVRMISSSNSSGSLNFTHLPGTAAEVQSLGAQFRRSFPNEEVVLLEKGAATEGAFWREAPRHPWLHIATHGFFAPAAIRSALAAQKAKDPAYQKANAGRRDPSGGRVSVFHVGFLNGLALAGANVGATDAGEDGIMTAAELSTMDLRKVDMAVLSGCETGLGELQGGEGSFGLQRALQIAGARATVGSLWTVSDEKTNLLMQRFYANMWDRKLSHLESLREAQLWMLRSGGSPQARTGDQKPLSPHYWAPFTLSGDWR